MSDKLPDLIDPLLLAERRSVMSGALRIAEFERLSDLLADRDGNVEIVVNFGKEGRQPVVSGSITGQLLLTCQTCLSPVPYPVDIAFKLGVVASMAAADRLDIDCEPLLYTGEKISLNALLEDEILLALPAYPRHGHDCLQHATAGADDAMQTNPARAENPFSVLARLKKNGD